jgi:hypothetical protein
MLSTSALTADKFLHRASGRLSPDELYSAGYRDGVALKAKHPQFCINLEYLKGYVAGYRANPDSLFNLPAVAESHLERGWGDELLNPC